MAIRLIEASPSWDDYDRAYTVVLDGKEIGTIERLDDWARRESNHWWRWRYIDVNGNSVVFGTRREAVAALVSAATAD